MDKLRCSINGTLDDSKFSEPMPWIGVYVAAASMACCAAMAVDAILGFRHRKLWFPCKFFSLNATSLTLTAGAVKLSVDLNTSMPSSEDQLAKLSSTVLICTVMGNSMPSFGTMANNEIYMNIMALGILVITVIVNVCIELATGAIYMFRIEHVCIMFLMIVLLVILSFSAVVVPTTKRDLENKYNKKLELVARDYSHKFDNLGIEKWKENLMKHWVMAHTSSPQFVVGRSVTCMAVGAFCLLGAMTLAEAVIRSYLSPWSKFCSGRSDYKWSTTLILIIQTLAVGVGTIAPAIRWFTAINFRCPNRNNIRVTCKSSLKVETYWLQRLVELKECPLFLKIPSRRFRKLVHALRNKVLDFGIRLQMGIVLICKVVQLLSILFVLCCCDCLGALKTKLKFNCEFVINDPTSESDPQKKLDLGNFVLYLEGEEELVDLMVRKNCNATRHWLQQGKRKQPKHLIQLLERYTSKQGFQGTREFDSEQVPSLCSEEPPNCWSLPVVTLTSIAVALPNITKCLTEQLLYGVNEGIISMRLIESQIDTEGHLLYLRKAAATVWQGVDLHRKWLGVDLQKLAIDAKGPYEVLEGLSNSAKSMCLEFHAKDTHKCFKENPQNWPINVLAANSMYRVCETILLKYRDDHSSETLFEGLSVMISDILCACHSNLRHALPNECVFSTIEKREEKVRHAVFLLGKCEHILNILQQQELSSLDSEQMANIDMWRLLRNRGSLPFETSSVEGITSINLSNMDPSIV